MSLFRDPDVTEPNFRPVCCVPGCTETEPGVGVETCVIWGGRRLCYARHFPEFASHPLSDACSERGSGPTEAEWKQFIAHVGGRSAA